jgi:dTDP-4-amino-4,6-dideoxygalactose transaminase
MAQDRRAVAVGYRKMLEGIKGVQFLPDDERIKNVYQLFTIILPGRQARDGLQKHLEAAGVQSKVYFEPAHKTHFYKQVLRYNTALPASEEMSGRVLSLPMFIGLGEREIRMVAGEVDAYMKTRA